MRHNLDVAEGAQKGGEPEPSSVSSLDEAHR
jgi:hypothetical protein